LAGLARDSLLPLEAKATVIVHRQRLIARPSSAGALRKCRRRWFARPSRAGALRKCRRRWFARPSRAGALRRRSDGKSKGDPMRTLLALVLVMLALAPG